MSNFELQIKDWQEKNRILKEINPNTPVLYSPPDPRTEQYPLRAIADVPTILPSKVDLSKSIPFILNQENCGWCVSFAMNGLMQGNLNYNKLMPEGGLSTTFLMSLCKEYDGIPNEEGTYISTALKYAQKFGTVTEKEMPFKGDCKVHKLTTTQKNNAKYKIKAYAKLNGLTEVKQALASGKFVIIGTIVTSNNWLDGDEFILVPDGSILGGHATFLVGYDDTKEFKGYKGFLKGVNSWGTEWGAKGFYYMAYKYVDYKLDIGLTPFMEAWAVTMEKDFPVAEPDEKDTKQIIKLDQSITLINNRLMVPARFITEINGGTITWDSKTQSATAITHDGKKVIMTVGSPYVTIE